MRLDIAKYVIGRTNEQPIAHTEFTASLDDVQRTHYVHVESSPWIAERDRDERFGGKVKNDFRFHRVYRVVNILTVRYISADIYDVPIKLKNLPRREWVMLISYGSENASAKTCQRRAQLTSFEAGRTGHEHLLSGPIESIDVHRWAPCHLDDGRVCKITTKLTRREWRRVTLMSSCGPTAIPARVQRLVMPNWKSNI
jgi:hypothetical protein